MGIFLNPGKGRFQMTLNGQIYVDKSEMISYLNTMVETPQRYLCVSRPRRFGKTTALDMLCAYYGIGADSREMFATQKLGQRPNWDRYLGKFHVLRLTMTQFFTRGLSFQEGIQRMRKLLARDFTKCFPDVDFLDAGDLILSMQDVYQTTQAKFVVVIDEWDSLFREYRDNRQAQHDYLDFLRDWLKDQDCIALAYMTGILPVKKYGKQSALNMFTEYSMLAPLGLAPYTGFTAEDVEELCRRFGRPFEAIREWYDGYQVSDEVPPDPDNLGLQSKLYHLYAPLSVVSAVRTGVIQNYWNKTESYEALAEYIRMDFDGLKETVAELMGGRRIPVSLRTYQNDMTSFTSKDDVLALLIHLGYLGYEQATGCAFIPNREILDEYYASTQGREWGATMRALKNSQGLLEATWAGNGKRVAE
ncbi:MAG: AAA family ATPase, partial [Victivallales bacterium]|nr:AAA family ATPase [Victivallales bacterium]